MQTTMERKMYMGIGRFMFPIPQVISARGLKKGVSSARGKSKFLSVEERKIHHFIVKKMAIVQQPIRAELISEELSISVDRVEKTMNKLEGLKTFLYRSDGMGINWAYPISLENTGHKISVSTGERFFAA